MGRRRGGGRRGERRRGGGGWREIFSFRCHDDLSPVEDKSMRLISLIMSVSIFCSQAIRLSSTSLRLYPTRRYPPSILLYSHHPSHTQPFLVFFHPFLHQNSILLHNALSYPAFPSR